MNPIVIYDFSSTSDSKDWRIINDGVMGGKSQGNFYINDKGHGFFEGIVSLENNGGFTSINHQFPSIKVTKNSVILLLIKGDKKEYQFRIKDTSGNYFSYITTFSTSGTWEVIEIPLKELYPSYRGRKLNLPNFNGNSFEEITILIANKKNERFQLEIDKIELN